MCSIIFGTCLKNPSSKINIGHNYAGLMVGIQFAFHNNLTFTIDSNFWSGRSFMWDLLPFSKAKQHEYRSNKVNCNRNSNELEKNGIGISLYKMNKMLYKCEKEYRVQITHVFMIGFVKRMHQEHGNMLHRMIN